MPVYHHFAKHYFQGPYMDFTRGVVERVFPLFLEVLEFEPASVLDLACGTGHFAIQQALKGLHVSAVDRSEAFLEIAMNEAAIAGAKVDWHKADIAAFRSLERFDCVTSWFDSLNYLVKIEDLANTFKTAATHLNPGGYFIFDMNTIYGLAVSWQRQPTFLGQDLPDYLEICRNSYDYENNLAQMRIIMFERKGKSWLRHEEVHEERGYAVDDIVLLLETAGLNLVHLLGKPLLMEPLTQQDQRMWVVAQKPKAADHA